jgi:hypothetical protein
MTPAGPNNSFAHNKVIEAVRSKTAFNFALPSRKEMTLIQLCLQKDRNG